MVAEVAIILVTARAMAHMHSYLRPTIENLLMFTVNLYQILQTIEPRCWQ